MLFVISVFLKESTGKQRGWASSLGGVWGEGAQREGIQPGAPHLKEGGSKDQSEMLSEIHEFNDMYYIVDMAWEIIVLKI